MDFVDLIDSFVEHVLGIDGGEKGHPRLEELLKLRVESFLSEGEKPAWVFMILNMGMDMGGPMSP